MTKLSRLALLLLLPLLSLQTACAETVEVTLIDKLDGNLSSYCIDIVGGGKNIDPANGLQAHTCYSYKGKLGADQAFDPAAIEEGIFRVVAFDVCMTLPNTASDTKLTLESCNGTEQQQFKLGETGNISPVSAPSMCLTAGQDTTFGRNGKSPHQIKVLSLQPCQSDIDGHQQWRMRTLE